MGALGQVFLLSRYARPESLARLAHVTREQGSHPLREIWFDIVELLLEFHACHFGRAQRRQSLFCRLGLLFRGGGCFVADNDLEGRCALRAVESGLTCQRNFGFPKA